MNAQIYSHVHKVLEQDLGRVPTYDEVLDAYYVALNQLIKQYGD